VWPLGYGSFHKIEFADGIVDHKTQSTLLHQACILNNIVMIYEILWNAVGSDPLILDNNLKLPLQLVNTSYLTSRKFIQKETRDAMLISFRQFEIEEENYDEPNIQYRSPKDTSYNAINLQRRATEGISDYPHSQIHTNFGFATKDSANSSRYSSNYDYSIDEVSEGTLIGSIPRTLILMKDKSIRRRSINHSPVVKKGQVAQISSDNRTELVFRAIISYSRKIMNRLSKKMKNAELKLPNEFLIDTVLDKASLFLKLLSSTKSMKERFYNFADLGNYKSGISEVLGSFIQQTDSISKTNFKLKNLILQKQVDFLLLVLAIVGGSTAFLQHSVVSLFLSTKKNLGLEVPRFIGMLTF